MINQFLGYPIGYKDFIKAWITDSKEKVPQLKIFRFTNSIEKDECKLYWFCWGLFKK